MTGPKITNLKTIRLFGEQPYIAELRKACLLEVRLEGWNGNGY